MQANLMLRRCLVLSALALETSTPSAADTAKAGYARINGLRMYYEIHGSGDPLILLHRGIMGSEGFGPNIEAFARTRQVIAVCLQGRGNTRDIARPLRYEQLADDVAALAAALHLTQVDVLGWSFGAATALQP
jgi:pimeloyl-ACP methyl ester carboxylesterase